MKKLTTIMAIACCLSTQAFTQSTTQPGPRLLPLGNVSTQNQGTRSIVGNQGTFAQPVQQLPKFGGMSAVSVAYTDDFSQPNDTTSLIARGYIPYYRGGGAQDGATWFQGNPNAFLDFNNGTDEYVASNYQCVTGANDIDNWLVLPSLDVAAGDVISFYCQSPLGSTWPDSVRVMYSAVGDILPEDLSWVELGRFEATTLGAWEQISYVAPAAGTTARFAIRYAVIDGGPNGANSNYVGIDQLDVFTPATLDLQAMDVTRINNEYTIIPLSQASSVSFTANVKNNGLSSASGGTALFEVFDTVTTTVVFSETVNVPSINAGATVAVNTTNSFTPSAAGILRSRITTTLTGDGNPSNDIALGGITEISDSVFARDDNQTSGSLGIGAGAGAAGIVGQNFTLTAQTDLTSISFFLTDAMNPNPAGTPVYATVHSQTLGSTPDNVALASTDSVSITPGGIAVGGQWFTLFMSGGSVQLPAGTYYVGVHEEDSTLTLGTTSSIVTPQTVWVTWATIPTPPAVNGWATADDFGFAVTYNLRMNFGTPTGIEEVESNSALISVYPSPAASVLNIGLDNSVKDATVEVYNSMSQLVKKLEYINGYTTLDVSGYANGMYSLKVISGSKAYTKRFTVAD